MDRHESRTRFTEKEVKIKETPTWHNSVMSYRGKKKKI